MLVFLIALLALGSAAFFAGETITVSSRARRTAVRRAIAYGSVRLTRPGQESFRERIVDPLAAKLAAGVLRLNPRTSVESVAEKLLAAGLSRSITPTGFLALKGALALGGAALGIVGGGMAGMTVGALLAVGCGFLGFVLPDRFLSSKANRRREDVRVQLPDALDLMAVSVEAGLGFDGAISKVTEHTEGALAEEFGLALSAMRVGENRAQALRGMVDRVPAPELAAFVRAVIQADQLGMSLGRILRVQAADARLRRQAAAEERAMKAPVKMLLPMALFIFPSMFIVILGPAFFNIMKVL